MSRSSQTGKKLQAQAKTASPLGLNIAPTRDPSINLGLTCDAADDDVVSLLGGAYLALDPEGDDKYLLGDNTSIEGGNVYPIGYASLRSSTATGHTSASNVKQATSLLTQ